MDVHAGRAACSRPVSIASSAIARAPTLLTDASRGEDNCGHPLVAPGFQESRTRPESSRRPDLTTGASKRLGPAPPRDYCAAGRSFSEEGLSCADCFAPAVGTSGEPRGPYGGSRCQGLFARLPGDSASETAHRSPCSCMTCATHTLNWPRRPEQVVALLRRRCCAGSPPGSRWCSTAERAHSPPRSLRLNVGPGSRADSKPSGSADCTAPATT